MEYDFVSGIKVISDIIQMKKKQLRDMDHIIMKCEETIIYLISGTTHE